MQHSGTSPLPRDRSSNQCVFDLRQVCQQVLYIITVKESLSKWRQKVESVIRQAFHICCASREACVFSIRSTNRFRPAARFSRWITTGRTNSQARDWFRQILRYHLHFTHTGLPWLNQIERGRRTRVGWTRPCRTEYKRILLAVSSLVPAPRSHGSNQCSEGDGND